MVNITLFAPFFGGQNRNIPIKSEQNIPSPEWTPSGRVYWNVCGGKVGMCVCGSEVGIADMAVETYLLQDGLLLAGFTGMFVCMWG